MKNKKMPFIVKEMNFSGNKYEINGIDLSKAQFYIRKNRELFKIVSPGDYTISNDGTNTYLSLTNSAILTNVISVQVVYFLSISSGKYEPGTEPDINILTANYNKLVEDFKKLWAYIKEQGFTADRALMPLVFPLLRNGETWIFENGEMKATPLVAAETELQKLLDELIKESHNILDDYVATLTANSKIEINNIVSDSKTDINDYTENKKEELQNFIDENMDNFATDLEVRKEVNYLSGAEYKENNIFGTNLKNITKGQMYYYGNIPYMAKITATNSSGFLIPDTINFQDIRNSTLYEQLYKNLLEFDKVIYNPGGGSNFWKFFRYGKRATFFISYTLSGEIWLEHTKVASFPIGFIPDTEFLYSEHKIYIKTNSHTGEERALLANDSVQIVGVAGKLIYEIRGIINYIVQ